MFGWKSKKDKKIEELETKVTLLYAALNEANKNKLSKQSKKRKHGGRKKLTEEERSIPCQIALKGVGDFHTTSDEERKEIYDAFTNGMTIVDIGKTFNRSHSCVYKQLKIEGELRHEQMGRLDRKKAGSSKK